MAEHWAKLPERKGLTWLRWLFSVYRLLGYRFISWILYPVAGIFLMTGKVQRRASQQYIQRIRQTAAKKGITLPVNLSSYQHFLRFAHAILDKLAGWHGDLRLGKQVHYANDNLCCPLPVSGRGGLILGSHLGDIEVCRALSQQRPGLTVHALVFNKHAQGFSQLLQEINPDAGVNLIQVDNLGPETAIFLQEKIAAGDWVAIMGDRIPVATNTGARTERWVWSDFLGQPAPFPQGPFILASLLKCPVYLMFALKQKNELKIFCEKFADPLLLPRAQRQEALQQAIESYATRLEHYCLQSPLDWFNFYNFWELPDRKNTDEKQQPTA